VYLKRRELTALRKKNHSSDITLELHEQDSVIGHVLRLPELVAEGWKNPSEESVSDVLIAGAGVAGLSAARILAARGVEFTLLEAGSELGGTSAYGVFDGQPAPLAAHYVVAPPLYAKEILSFYQEAGIISGFNAGLPEYDRKYTIYSHEGKERTFFQKKWYSEGEFKSGMGPAERKFSDFCRFMSGKRDSEGCLWFCLPTGYSSRCPEAMALFEVSFSDYLRENGMWDEEVEYAVNYACMDDYGCLAEDVSAWAGLHYFTCRESEPAHPTITHITGNGHLIDALAANVPEQNIHLLSALVGVRPFSGGFRALVRQQNNWKIIRAKKIIYAGRTLFMKRIFPELFSQIDQKTRERVHIPWLVTNLLLRNVDEKILADLCWDNINRETDSVGYVAPSFLQDKVPEPLVLTHYFPVGAKSGISAQKLSGLSLSALRELVLADIGESSPELLPFVYKMIFRRSCHAMVESRPGYVFNSLKNHSGRVIDNFYIANCDYYGLPLFEDAFQSGIDVAAEILTKS
jgi:hypothetical protein